MRIKIIAGKGRAYNSRMKKTMIVFCVSVACLFVFAFSLCVNALAVSVVSLDAPLCVVLDAGHGGIDGGVSGKRTGVKESEINLSIVMKLKPLFEDAGFEVVLTRKTDGGLYGAASKGFKKRDMQKRKEIIEEASPALVISVHQNYYPSAFLRGGQVFFDRESEGGKAFALFMQKQFNALYAEEGVKERSALSGEYFILRCASAPSVIAECGFLSNETDEALLTSERFQARIAEAIFGAALEYLSVSAGA